MKIKILTYICEQNPMNPEYFTLFEKQIKSGAPPPKAIEYSPIYYGLSLEDCILKIIAKELEKRDEVVSLQVYLEEYKKLRNKISDALK